MCATGAGKGIMCVGITVKRLHVRNILCMSE